MQNKRVAVIGAGPSGTAVLRAFASAKEKGEIIPEIVCFEKQSSIGGLWNYDYRSGCDSHGDAVHGSMYRYLWSNGPKEALEFADYSFEEHFGKPIASFPPREVLFDYIKGRIEKANVNHWIRLETAVRWIDFNESTGQFTVVSHDLNTDTQSKETFDHVICCSGHFSTPNIPHFQGMERYEGHFMHAHEFRNAALYKDMDVMVVGASYSAEDIGSQCWKYGAKSLTACYRTSPMEFHWPDNWETKPLIDHVDGKTVHFVDGTSKDIDVIILCTGYMHNFPYMDDSVRLVCSNRMWVSDLYKGVVLRRNPKMYYLGMQDQWFTFNMFDAQAWWVRDNILGKVQLPSTLEEISQHSQKWCDREATLKSDEDMIRFQGDYVKELISETDYPSFDIDQVCEIFMEWEHNKHSSIMEFRDKQHRSVMTGTLSPVHHTKWTLELDDSMKAYLQ